MVELVPLVPQPTPRDDKWEWPANNNHCITDSLENLLTNGWPLRMGPYQEGDLHGQLVIRQVDLLIQETIWYWRLHLAPLEDWDFWRVLRRPKQQSGCTIPPDRCEGCGVTQDLRWARPMTAYHFEEGAPDPNVLIRYCRECEEEHIKYWDAMWDEYNRGRL